jgi:hypothetical protein
MHLLDLPPHRDHLGEVLGLSAPSSYCTIRAIAWCSACQVVNARTTPEPADGVGLRRRGADRVQRGAWPSWLIAYRSSSLDAW